MPTWSQLTVDLVLFLIPTAIAVRGLVRMRRAGLAAEGLATDVVALAGETERIASRLAEVGSRVAAAFGRLLEARSRGATASNRALERVARGIALPYEDGEILAFALVAAATILLAQPPQAVASTLAAVEAPSVAGLLLLRVNASVAGRRIAVALREALDADARPRAGS